LQASWDTRNPIVDLGTGPPANEVIAKGGIHMTDADTV